MMITRTGEATRWGDHSSGEGKGRCQVLQGRAIQAGRQGLQEVSGEGQAGEASPLSTWHCSTDRWSQAGARRKPGQCSCLRPDGLGCGTYSHSLLWQQTWGRVGLRTVHPRKEGGPGGGQAADPETGALSWISLLCP